MMGYFDIFRRSKRQVVRDNAVQGKDGEDRVKTNYEWGGYKVKRTGRGHDYKATRRDWLTGKKEIKYIEVKTGNGKLSSLQKKRKRSLGKKYVVERVQPNPFATSVGIDILGSSRSKNARKTKRKTTRSVTKKKPSPSLWGSSGLDIFGSPTSKSKKSRSSSLDSVWGFSSKPKRTRKKSNKRKSSKETDQFGFGNIGF